MTISSRGSAILALVAANVIWGTTFVVTKPLLEQLPPLTLAAFRFAIALLVLLPVLARGRRRPILNRSTAVMGFTGVFLVYFCQNVGLQFTSASNGALIHGGIPVFTLLCASLVIQERFGKGRLVGLGLSVVGVATVVLFGSDRRFDVSVLGDSLVLLSGFGLAAYFVLGRRAFPGGSSLELVGGVAVWGLLFLAPASAVEVVLVGIDRPSVGDLIGLLYLGAAASALAFILWAHGLRHMDASEASVFANLNPLIGVAVAAAFLGDRIGPAQILGGLLILAGVWLATRPQLDTTLVPNARPNGADRSVLSNHAPIRDATT